MEALNRNEMGKIAIIPARAGSKRVNGKNLRMICEKPLIAYTVEAALASGAFDCVYVNSEDDRILKTAEAYGAAPYVRPAGLATDTTFVIDVVKEMLGALKAGRNTLVGILFPTCPLRSGARIREAFEIFIDSGANTPVVAVTQYEYPIQVALRIDESGRLTTVFQEDYKRSTRHNDHSPTYHANYSIIFNTAENLSNQEKLIGPKPIPFIMPYIESIDIDEPFQLEIVEALLQKELSRQ